jgi:hypothetical protein
MIFEIVNAAAAAYRSVIPRVESSCLELGRERLGPFGVRPGQCFFGHLERTCGLWWRTDDEPKLLGVGVVEDVSDLAWFDEHAAEARERVEIGADPDAASALD